MARRISFIHVADLHFGAAPRGLRNVSPEWGDRLAEAVAESFDRVVDTALARRVDFVVIAGDSFDATRASYGDYLRFFKGLERLSQEGVPTYLTTGNNDPYSAWRRDLPMLPEGAFMVGAEGPEFALYSREEEPLCLIAARGYANQTWPSGKAITEGLTRASAVQALRGQEPRVVEAPFSIAIVHAGLQSDQSGAQVDPAALLDTDIDYWACGHQDRRLVLPNEFAPRIGYPGRVQSCDVKEAGECGCFLVTMEERPGAWAPRIRVEFVPTAKILLSTVEVDVGDCRTLADVRHLTISHLFGKSSETSCENMVVRVVFTGETALHAYLSDPEVTEPLRRRINDAYPSFYCDALVDNTRAVRSKRTLERQGLFAAQVLRVSAEQAERETEMVNYVQDEFVKRGVSIPSALVDSVREYCADAEALVLDLLDRDSAMRSGGDGL